MNEYGEPCCDCVSTLRSQLAAAKAEIKHLRKDQEHWASSWNAERKENKRLLAEIERLNKCSSVRWGDENVRLRETIQRNEDKSVECERFRQALEDLKAISCPHWSIASAALAGGKPSMPEPTHGGSCEDGGKA